MDHLNAIRVFLAVARRNSFTAAAHELRLSPAAVTRAIAMLEAELGVDLFARTTRSVRLTEKGAFYAERGRTLLADFDELQAAVRGENAAPRGMLSITAPVVFGRRHVLPLAEALMAKYEDLDIRLILLDRVTQMVEEGFDLAVRIGDLPDSSLMAIKLTRVWRVVVASPSYLAAFGVPETPADLRRHKIISFDGVGATDDWHFGAQARQSVRVSPKLRVNFAEAAIDAALRGVGLTRVLSYQVADEVKRGDLSVVLANWESPPIPVSLVYPAGRRASVNIQTFVHEARKHFPLL